MCVWAFSDMLRDRLGVLLSFSLDLYLVSQLELIVRFLSRPFDKLVEIFEVDVGLCELSLFIPYRLENTLSNKDKSQTKQLNINVYK